MIVVRFILALLIGTFAGAAVNGSLIALGGMIFPLPKGVGFDTPAALDAFRTLPVKYYLFPFLAHAIGTLTACLVALRITISHAAWVTYPIAYLFFVGGIVAVDMINAPVWFDILDLSFAYIPMAWLAMQSRLAKKS